MLEERLERMENHMVQLIQMVAHNNQSISELKQDVGELKVRMGGLEKRMDSLEQRMDSLEQRMDGLEQRMDGLEQRMDGLEQKFAEESELNRKRHTEVMGRFRNVDADIDYLRNRASKQEMDIHRLKTQSTEG